MPSRNHSCATSSRGFSLVELLVVMAVLVVMLSLAGPAMNALKGANDVNQATADLSSIFEQARAYAMANNTYAFVGLHQKNSENQFGVQYAVFASKDGTWDTSKSDNVQQIGRLKTIENAVLDDSIGEYGTRRPDAAVKINDSLDSGAKNLKARSGSTTVDFTTALRFSPSGTVQAQGLNAAQNSLQNYIETGLRQTRGTTKMDKDDSKTAVVQVSGLTGTVQTYRP